MIKVLIVAVLVSIVTGVLWDCTDDSSCASEQVTFKIPGSVKTYCCPGYFQGYTVATRLENGVVIAKCQCYISNVG